MIGAPAAQLTSERLSLTPLKPEDAKVITNLLGNPQVRRYLGGPVPAMERHARFETYLKGARGIGIWAVRLSPEADAIGLIILAPHHTGSDTEVSYQLDPNFWAKGYATEAVACVIAHALGALALPRVVAETQSANTASCRLLHRLGMQEIETLERFGQRQTLFATPSKDRT